MKIHVLNTGNFKLDGGAMFGVVPKSLWQRTNPADANNLCDWSMRSLLIEDGDKLTLIDTGIGDKQTEKFFSHYYLNGDDSLQGNLKKLGFSLEDVTDVILTHLHFDHCGGAIKWNKERTGFEPVFKNATYWSTEKHWEWATLPSGQLKFIERNGDFTKNVFNKMDMLFVDGHTESMMIPHIEYQDKKIIFMADLLPSTGHIPLPYVMGYDTRPLLTLSEKEKFLNTAVDNDYILFLEHDSANECCTLKRTEKGVQLDKTFQFSELFQ